MNNFDRANRWVRDSEASLVNLLSAIAPWAAPLAPAFMSYQHMTNSLAFPVYISWAVAIVVEVLGLSAISTIITFWAHNRKYKLEQRKAPVWMAMLSFLAYLGVVLTVNVVLDAAYVHNSGMDPEWVKVGAKALLTLLSVPAAIILAVRTQYHEMLREIETVREEQKQERIQARAGRLQPQSIVQAIPEQQETSERKKKQFLEDYGSGALKQALNGSHMNPSAIAGRYGVSERTAFRWLAQIKGDKVERADPENN